MTYDIKEQLHYNVWRDIESVFFHKSESESDTNDTIDTTDGKANRLSQGILLNICVILAYFYAYGF